MLLESDWRILARRKRDFDGSQPVMSRTVWIEEDGRMWASTGEKQNQEIDPMKSGMFLEQVNRELSVLRSDRWSGRANEYTVR